MSDKKLSEVIANYRTDRPDEWYMDIFIRGAEKLEAERDALQAKLDESVDRIKDILKQDDGQAYKEAERFLNKLEGKGYE